MEERIQKTSDALKEDSNFFVEKLKKKHEKCNPYDMEVPLDNEAQREVRWHVNAINLFNLVINENAELEKQMTAM